MSFGVGRTFSSGSNGRIEEALDDDIFNEIQVLNLIVTSSHSVL